MNNEVNLKDLIHDTEIKYYEIHKEFIEIKQKLNKIRYAERCIKYLDNETFLKTSDPNILIDGIISTAHHIHYKEILKNNKKEAGILSDIYTTKIKENEILTYPNKYNFSIDSKI